VLGLELEEMRVLQLVLILEPDRMLMRHLLPTPDPELMLLLTLMWNSAVL
jgi:hypothetical protein